MTVAEFVSGIKNNQHDLGWTNQQLADASGVPLSSVNRILRGETPNPTAQTILDLAHAVGYTFGGDTHLPPVPVTENTDTAHAIAAYRHQCELYERTLTRDEVAHNRIIAEKNRWIKLSLLLNIILVAFIIGILLYDIANTDVGWVRGQLQNWTNHGWFSVFRI